MAFLKKIFGSKSPLEQARRLFEQGEYVRLLQYVEQQQIEDADLAPMVDQARKTLQERNLEEARLRLSQGDRKTAREHLELAARFGADAEELAAIDREFPGEQPDTTSAPQSCTSCNGSDMPVEVGELHENLNDQDALELLLAAMPEDVADRYREKSPVFLQALLASGRGDDAKACALLQECPEQDHDALYDFELAAALCRCGQPREGVKALERCLSALPSHAQAWELAADLYLQGTDIENFEERLESLASCAETAGFANLLLCRVAWQKGQKDRALERGELCLAAGNNDPEVIQIVALCLEQRGDIDRAEALLTALPGGGCGGGAHPMLAEFWLRQGRQLDKALESFKAMARQERNNPLWQLRMAETYLARGWTGEALRVVEALESVSELPDAFRSVLAELRQRMAQE
ncbi:MAG: hypothetical protein Tsb0017_08060 [Geothermobacteraceae bacterium]